MSDVDARIMLLAGWLCLPTWRAAFRMASDRTRQVVGFDAVGELEAAVTILDRIHTLSGFAQRVRVADPVLSCAWKLLALRPTDDQSVIHAAVAGAIGVVVSADGDTREARARLRVWDDVARGKHDTAAYGDDFFAVADMYWRGETRFIVAAAEGDNNMRPATEHPALTLLTLDRWDDAFGWLHGTSEAILGAQRSQAMLDALRDRLAVQTEIQEAVEYLYEIGTPRTGALALAWSMLTVDPERPHTFWHVLPQLQFAVDRADLDADTGADLRQRIRIWWRAAEAEWTGSEVSIFRIADVETRADNEFSRIDTETAEQLEPHISTAATLFADIGLPTLVVMPADKATKLNNLQSAYKDLVDAPLPLVTVRNLAGIRAELHAEFPHAVTAVDLMLRDLRDQRPFRLKPVCLVGSPGAGKSRLVRRLADLARGLYVYRFDASSSTDAVGFSGSAKSWSNTEPSVPFRAIAQSKTANPVVLIDEIEKSSGHRHASGRCTTRCSPTSIGRRRPGTAVKALTPSSTSRSCRSSRPRTRLKSCRHRCATACASSRCRRRRCSICLRWRRA
ncbi:hypothetical protein V1278_003183 [Bradyrhizobium sp. AZCC 1577]|uniref:AAA family ATPase n=1 Tax=Bradyrhizobium sp. AZCC 1577 TaxID=3117019 RepID=UPI002FF399D8